MLNTSSAFGKKGNEMWRNLLFCIHRKKTSKHSAFTGLALHFNVAAVFFHYFFTNGQAHAGTLVLVAIVQALKHLEDFFVVFCRYADAIIRK